MSTSWRALATGVAAAALLIGAFTFGAGHPATASASAAAKADAKAKAAQYARTLGRVLGPLVSMTETTASPAVPEYGGAVPPARSPAVPLSPGTEQLSVTVTAVFALA